MGLGSSLTCVLVLCRLTGKERWVAESSLGGEEGADVVLVGFRRGGDDGDMAGSVGFLLIGRPSFEVVLHGLFLGLHLLLLPVLVFLVFFEFISSLGYCSMRALLPERFEPSGSAPSSLKSQSTMSYCSSSSWVGSLEIVVLKGGAERTYADVPVPAPAAQVAVRVEGVVPF